jgi:hypothetical protein
MCHVNTFSEQSLYPLLMIWQKKQRIKFYSQNGIGLLITALYSAAQRKQRGSVHVNHASNVKMVNMRAPPLTGVEFRYTIIKNQVLVFHHCNTRTRLVVEVFIQILFQQWWSLHVNCLSLANMVNVKRLCLNCRPPTSPNIFNCQGPTILSCDFSWRPIWGEVSLVCLPFFHRWIEVKNTLKHTTRGNLYIFCFYKLDIHNYPLFPREVICFWNIRWVILCLNPPLVSFWTE